MAVNDNEVREYGNRWFSVVARGEEHRVVNAAPFGVVLSVRSTDGLALLVGQHRYAIGDALCWETPRGNGRHGESYEDAAMRILDREVAVAFPCTWDGLKHGVRLETLDRALHMDTGLVSDNVRVVRVTLPVDSTAYPLGGDDRYCWADIRSERLCDFASIAALALA